MSERWSFCTEYIYCSECAKAVRETAERVLDFSQTNRGLAEFQTTAIIAGFGGGLGPSEPPAYMRAFTEALRPVICHPVRLIAFYDDESHEFFRIEKDAK